MSNSHIWLTHYRDGTIGAAYATREAAEIEKKYAKQFGPAPSILKLHINTMEDAKRQWPVVEKPDEQ